MIRVRNIEVKKNVSDDELLEIVCNRIKIKKENIKNWHIEKKSIDARDKDDIKFVYRVQLELNIKENIKGTEAVKKVEVPMIKVNRKSNISPVIVGAGPAGLFTALTLVENGIKPTIIEQGKTVDERKKDIDAFWEQSTLNTMSNVQFGEGGAGTFSDGKLTTGISSVYCNKVLEEFVRFGAPKDIMYESKPHIGTDNLVNVVKNMREYIISKGGNFLFSEKVKDFKIQNNKITAVICSKEITTDTVILAIGHSSRDTFEKLLEKGIDMEKKAFSVGARIEHKQKMIDEAQYGSEKKELKLPHAEYKLVYHDESGRTAYTFCMCPGGQVIASSSEEKSIVTNGMSRYARDAENANSALLVNVNPEDFESKSPLAGMYFQRELEQKAFVLANNSYKAPVQRVGDFLNNKKSEGIGNVFPTYMPGFTLSDLNKLFPEYISETMKKAICFFDKRLKGFAYEDAILTGVETRSSSPVRILRNESFVSNIEGIYPCGEGSGYAGGIMSSAVDGIKIANAILERE